MSAGNKSGGMKVKPPSSSIGKSSIKQSADTKHESVSTTEVKTKSTTGGSSKTSVTKTVTKTREKKVYTLPGQKYDVPEEREPLRIFYESLSQQIPSSEMAEFWLMEHGLLSPDRAKKAFEKKQKKHKQLRTGTTPINSPPPPTPSKPESSKRPQHVSKNGEVKAKKKIIDDSDNDDDEFIIGNKRRKG